MAFGAPSVKGLALRHLARREHSRAELQRKLEHKVEDLPDAPAAEQIAAALDDLAARGFQSDSRTAEMLLTGAGRRFGSRRLKQTLQAKGLAPDLVASTVQQAKTTEYARAVEIWQRRFPEPAVDAADRARQARFLLGRGFDADIVRRIIRGLPDE